MNLLSISPWNKEHKRRRDVKRAKSEGRSELKEILSTTDGSDSIVSHPEYSVNHSIIVRSSVEENVDLLSHLESDHEQLKAENKELRNNLEELKVKLKQLEDELETVKIENKSLRQDNYKLRKGTLFKCLVDLALEH